MYKLEHITKHRLSFKSYFALQDLPIFILCAVALWLYTSFLGVISEYDSTFYVMFFDLMAFHHAIPYKDLFTTQMPFYFYLVSSIWLLCAFFGLTDKFFLFVIAQFISITSNVISIFLVYLIGRRIRNRLVGVVSAAIFALSPLSFHAAISVVPLSLAIMFTLASITLFLTSGNSTRYFLAGLLFGIACMTRASMLLMLPIFVLISIWLWYKSRKLESLELIMLGFALPLLVFGTDLIYYNALKRVLFDHLVKGSQPYNEKLIELLRYILGRETYIGVGLFLGFPIILSGNWENRFIGLAGASMFFEPVLVGFFDEFYVTEMVCFAAMGFGTLIGFLVGSVSVSRSHFNLRINSQLLKCWLLIGLVFLSFAMSLGYIVNYSINEVTNSPPIKELEKSPVVGIIKAYTKPEDYVISDLPIFTYLAGRRCPPEIADTDYTRFFTNSLTPTRLILICEKYQVQLIIIGTNLDSRKYFKWYHIYLAQNYVQIGDVYMELENCPAEVWVRKRDT
ncbi:MAG: glycosyltransferase family 39 protein [Candidatus Bathyarchaeia archaeon]